MRYLFESGLILFVFMLLAAICGFIWSEKQREKAIEAGAEKLRQEIKTWKRRGDF